MYQKDFDGWNKVKKVIHNKGLSPQLYFHEREIWWCSIGLNVGSEIDGKNQQFERPVLIFKKFNQHTAWMLPMTKSVLDQRHCVQLKYRGEVSHVVLSQLRLVSTFRLTRRVRTLSKEEFETVKEKIIQYIKNDSPP